MSDDPKAKDAKPAEPAKPGEGEGAKLASREMKLGDHLFIWSMIILVGIVFGVGPSIGLIFAPRPTLSSYPVDSVQIQRRQEVATVLQNVLNPMFQRYGGPVWMQNDGDGYARQYLKAQLAKDRGLMPSPEDTKKLVQDFYAQKTFDGRTHIDRLRDDARGSAISIESLGTFLAEDFACDALDASDIIAPPLSRAAINGNRNLTGTTVQVDELVLSARPLIEEVPADDPELASAYDRLVAEDRFIIAPMRLLTVAVADIEPVLASVAAPDEAAIAAWYESHKQDYLKPSSQPDHGQTQPPAEYLPLDEVREQVVAAIRRDQASKLCQAKADALEQLVVDRDLESADAKAFASAAAEAGMTVHEDVAVSLDNSTDVDLGALGILSGRSARDVGLSAGKADEYISDSLRVGSGSWVVLRYTGDRPAERRSLDEVRDEVRAWLAARRAYPRLLAEAERLRAAAEAAGPGGLRTIHTGDVAARWPAGVRRATLGPSETLSPPEPADEGAAPGEPRMAASIAVSGNPVVLVNQPQDGDVAQVRLIQCVGLKPPEPIQEEIIPRFLEWIRGRVNYGQRVAAYQDVNRQISQ